MFLKVKCPAKINLTLDVLGIRDDGYQEIASLMQTISLYDYLSVEVTSSSYFDIDLDGDNPDIPYDERNLVYKAIKLFIDNNPDMKPHKIKVFLEKNIPTEAGLGGGSSDAAGIIWALNKIFELNLSKDKINSLCGALGSDLNVCYWGGASIAASRGEKLLPAPHSEHSLSIIKPKAFGISAKDGYKMFDNLKKVTISKSTDLMINALKENLDIEPFLHNDLEIAPLKNFEVLQAIKKAYPKSIMTGSGSAYFVLDGNIPQNLPLDEYMFISGLKFVPSGVEEAL